MNSTGKLVTNLTLIASTALFAGLVASFGHGSSADLPEARAKTGATSASSSGDATSSTGGETADNQNEMLNFDDVNLNGHVTAPEDIVKTAQSNMLRDFEAR